MKNTDLRIGNWVSLKGCHKQVVCVKYSKICVMNGYPSAIVDLEDIKPIPITEEILLKCGFEKGCFYHTKPIDFKVKINEYYYILIYFLDGDLNCYVTDMGDYECESEIFVYIKYLHELQNLISSLKGQELKIEL